MPFTLKRDKSTWKSCDVCREKDRLRNKPTKHHKPTKDASGEMKSNFDAGANLARVNREEQVYANVESSQAASQCLPCKKPNHGAHAKGLFMPFTPITINSTTTHNVCDVCREFTRLRQQDYYASELGKVQIKKQNLRGNAKASEKLEKSKWESASKRAKKQGLAEPMSMQEIEAIADNIIAENKVCIFNPLPIT